jgi:hypothetical protein
MGARPLEIATNDAMLIERWLAPDDRRDGGVGTAVASGACFLLLLGSVRTLKVAVQSLLTPTDAVRLLRAAPHLEKLTVSVFASDVDVDASWLGHPAFDGLVHSKLKRMRVSGLRSIFHCTSDRILQLRQRQFPRLKGVVIDRRSHFVTPLEPPSFAKSLFSRFARFAARFIS